MENLEIELQVLEDAKTVAETMPDGISDLFLLLLEAESRRVKDKMQLSHNKIIPVQSTIHSYSN